QNGQCLNREVFYRDSLFARYYFDNFVLRFVTEEDKKGASIFNKNTINQTQWIFDFGGNKKNVKNLDLLKTYIIQTLDIMRIDDGIAISHLSKATEVKLSPTNYENKRKIIRLVNQ